MFYILEMLTVNVFNSYAILVLRKERENNESYKEHLLSTLGVKVETFIDNC